MEGTDGSLLSPFVPFQIGQTESVMIHFDLAAASAIKSERERASEPIEILLARREKKKKKESLKPPPPQKSVDRSIVDLWSRESGAMKENARPAKTKTSLRFSPSPFVRSFVCAVGATAARGIEF